ncbi:hypothetical protein, partial [Lactiplantibacillus plantarum]|uniref:hypothetical protein n=1 Tax=Lactiplantibacillus plantarum TaxID=1590 RepID=UPI001C9E4521
ISKAGLEKFEDFSRPALFLETYVTASNIIDPFFYDLFCKHGCFNGQGTLLRRYSLSQPCEEYGGCDS